MQHFISKTQHINGKSDPLGAFLLCKKLLRISRWMIIFNLNTHAHDITHPHTQTHTNHHSLNFLYDLLYSFVFFCLTCLSHTFCWQIIIIYYLFLVTFFITILIWPTAVRTLSLMKFTNFN